MKKGIGYLIWDILAEGLLDVSPMPTKVQEEQPQKKFVVQRAKV